MSKRDFLKEANGRVLIFDGGMGAALQKSDLTLDDYEGHENCSDIVSVTRPDVIGAIHAAYFEVGSDCVETNTFGANRIVLEEFGIPERAYELNVASAKLARSVADGFETPGRPRFVAGSIGPGTKAPTLGHITFDRLAESYEEQARGLMDGGADALIIETCIDLLQTKSAIVGCERAFKVLGRKIPLIVQVTIEQSGRMLIGSDIGAAYTTLDPYDSVDVIGVNCATGPGEMTEHIRYLAEVSSRPVSCQPNAGLPENVDGVAVFPLQPKELAAAHRRFILEFGVNIVGGCCGTTPDHLKAVVEACAGLEPAPRKNGQQPSVTSCYSSVPYEQDPKPLIVGEEANAVGSKRFKEFTLAKDYDAMVKVGKTQVDNGAHVIDVCVALTGEDELDNMTRLVARMATAVKAPLMIDSTEADAIEAALKLIPGKPIVNSINLEDGEDRINKVMPLVRRFGTGVVALTIDEEGMAKTTGRKFEIAKRIYNITTGKWGLPPHDLIFDALTFTLGSGEGEFRSAAVETIEAIRRIKAELPGAQTILGVSNVSFGLDKDIRPILNSVFLHYAVEAGLDMAIVSAKKILPLFKIPEEDRKVARRLVFNESESALMDFIAHFQKSERKSFSAAGAGAERTIEERLEAQILDGEKIGLIELLDEALKQYRPMEIVNNILLAAMRRVGDLMGSGEMQLPFVLQSAETMKASVGYLEPMMEKGEAIQKGVVILATVKGDVHDIGKNLVEIILRNNGYQTVNLGIKQPAEPIMAAARDHGAIAVGLSGLLVKSTVEMKYIVQAMGEAKLEKPVLCGGAALTRRYVEEDIRSGHCAGVYYAADAFEGLRILDELSDPKSEKKLTGKKAPAEKALPAKPVSSVVAEEKKITFEAPPPAPPFVGARIVDLPGLEEIYGYVHEHVLFKQQFGVKGYGKEENSERDAKLREEVEALKRDAAENGWLKPAAVYGYFSCQSDGDDLIVYADAEGKAERCRFRFPRQQEPPARCLSDYFYSVGSGVMDVAAFQIVTVGKEATAHEKKLYASDRYKEYLFAHGLAVETAEALAEIVHRRIRLELGFEADEPDTINELFRQKYRGRRYSFGYGACPDLAEQAKILDLLDGEKQLGIRLTDGDMLDPEQSTSAIVVHHPQARYFSV